MMGEFDEFHAAVKRVTPDQPVDDHVYWIGLLPPEKIPADVKEQADLLWIKAKRKITAAKIKNAFCTAKKVKAADIFLKFGDKVLPDFTRLGDLDSFHDKVVAIEAVTEQDLARRLTPVHQIQTPRQPLHNVSNQRVESSVPRTPTLSPDAVRQRPSLATHAMPTSTNAATTSAPDRSPPSKSEVSADAPVYHPDMEDRTLMAFTSFACERRELAQRFNPGKPYDEVKAEIAHDWFGIGHTTRIHLTDRAFRIAATAKTLPSTTPAIQLLYNCRGFWSLYYSRLEMERRRGFDPHRDTASGDIFFDQILKDWSAASLETRLNYVRPHMESIQSDPIRLPDTPVRLTPALSNKNPLQSPNSQVSPDIKGEHAEIATIGETVKTEHELKVKLETEPQAAEEYAPVPLSIQELFSNSSPGELEKGVEKGIDILNKIKDVLSSHNQGQDVGQWLRNIENVAKQAERSKTIVGVVGNTGAGKSSVINALLDEERLVPTNCMRACTAVVTEISYNHEEEPYRAEIEFISADAWKNELNVLFQDLLDGNGAVSRESSNEDTEAGIAYAKIKAVYPKLTKEDMANSSVEALMKHSNVARLLGSSRSLSSSDPARFYKDLQHYVDSKEKATGKKTDKEKSKPREMEFWPLIRVVRLFVKADALSTGAVIVDLPGVHDSNQARAAVAESYMKQCTGLWIVAPINRAVDDKAAKSLLGESFKRQLKMDGGFSTVTFICSKTDDISLIEAQDSLGLEEEMGALWEQSDNLDKEARKLQKEIEGLKESKADFNAALESADEELETWEKLLEDLDDGQTVYAPKTKSSKKRKVNSSPTRSRKRPKHLSDDEDDEEYRDASCEEESSASESEGEEGESPPLTEEEVQHKISELRATKRYGRREKARLDESIKELRGQVSGIKAKKDDVDAEMSAICISGRNQYSKGAIQQDFAAGIRELDQEIAEEQDAANFNPDVDARDYNEVAQSLPVFCVSSRGYQKLQGRLKKDPPVPGFKNIEETEVPQLQAHCKKLTEAGRDATCRRFLNSLSQLLNSLRLWSSNDGTKNLTAAQKAREADILHDRFAKLDKDLENAIKSVCRSVSVEFQDQIYDHFDSAIRGAVEAASPTVTQWGAPVNRDNRAAGGLYWSTYKAVCRRDGIYSNAQGLLDFNAQLTDPMLKLCAPGWERCFTRRVPVIMAELAVKSGRALDEFHKVVEERATRNGTSVAAFHMLKQQLRTYKETFKDIARIAREELITKQKDINREFVPVVARAMQDAYNGCVAECGPGSFMRMKALMTQHVENEKMVMFRESTKTVQGQLKRMVAGVEQNMLSQADPVFLAVKRDYMSAVLGNNHVSTANMPRIQGMMKSEISEIIEHVESTFKKELGIKSEDNDEDQAKEARSAVRNNASTVTTNETEVCESSPVSAHTSSTEDEKPETPAPWRSLSASPPYTKDKMEVDIPLPSVKDGAALSSLSDDYEEKENLTPTFDSEATEDSASFDESDY